MEDNEKEQIRLHSAGATVRHKSNFENLVSFKNNVELTNEFIQKWAVPFYMEIGMHGDNKWIEKIKKINKEITPDITLALLGAFNWRTRLVGAYFSAVKGFQDQIDIIGTHFLKSEVCCVGHVYAIVLALYNDKKTDKYLNDYLDYYLQKPDLYFDQGGALSAVAYLDKTNGTNNIQRHLPNWVKLQEDREELTKENTLRTAKILEEQQGKEFAETYLKSMNEVKATEIKTDIDTKYIEQQINILHELKKYCC